MVGGEEVGVYCLKLGGQQKQEENYWIKTSTGQCTVVQ